MAKSDIARIQRGALTAEEAEALFATVDETGHTNEETAAKERRRRKEYGHGVEVDPLAGDDPSGSNVEQVMTRTAVTFVAVFLILVVAGQISYGIARRIATANLSEHVTIETVASALQGGVEWGNGFTQFPEDFTVSEADENTHRITVTVVDTSSKNALECFAGSQIQASAFAVNALLNPNIDTIVYNVDVHMDERGEFQHSALFGFLKPTGDIKRLMTFVWTKVTTDYGVRFNCVITGVDAETEDQIRERITSSFTPSALLSSVLGNDDEESEEKDENSSASSDTSNSGNALGSATSDKGASTDAATQDESSSADSASETAATSEALSSENTAASSAATDAHVSASAAGTEAAQDAGEQAS